MSNKENMKGLLLVSCLSMVGLTSSAQSTVSVDLSAEHQTITGFGAFGGIKAYWQSPPFYTSDFIDYFLDDLGSTIVRTNIFWDLEPANDNASPFDLDLTKFNYKSGSNLANQLPYYKALKDAGLKKLIATSWTPPVWMKQFDDPSRIPNECYNCNNCPVGDPNRQVCGGKLNPAYYHEFAEYLVAYVKILKQEIDLDLYAINIQNEPFFANPFEAAVVLPEEFADILRIVGQHFRQEGLTTKIFGPEHMAEWSWGVQQNYVAEILNDNTVNPYLDIYAVHSYVDGVAPDYGSAEGWSELFENITVNYNKPLWMTETSGYAQTLEGAMNLAKSMYLALRFGNISAWVYWGISGEPGSEFSLMANGEPTILYYTSKQFFKFITPGSIRVQTLSSDEDVLTLGFKNPADGSMSLILINTSADEKTISLDIPIGPGDFTVYRTSSADNCKEIGMVTNSVALPAMSISSLVGYGAAGPSMDEVPNFYLTAGSDGVLEIPLTDIRNGGGGTITVDVENSNSTVVTNLSLDYTSPETSGVLTVTTNTSTPGTSEITITLTNQNDVAADLFVFNSTEVTFAVEVVDVITSLKKSEIQTLNAYPNPVKSDYLFIALDEGGPYSLEVLSDTGQHIGVLHEKEDDQVRIYTGNWQSGIYFINLATGKQRATYKIVIP
jgi:O-glycosyl hydrolase